MDVETSDGPVGECVVRVSGRLTEFEAPRMREVITDVLAADGKAIVLELSAVDFMDSTGLGVVIACLKSVRQAEGDLRIAAPSWQVMMVLKLAGLDRVFTLYEKAEHAFADEGSPWPAT